MPHAFAQNILHVIFSTKDRRRILSRELQPRLRAYINGICVKHALILLAVDGAEDHVHLLLRVPPSLPVARAINAIKANSSRWANGQNPGFGWQQGYAAFSVSASLVPAVTRYIQNQSAHHRRMSFEQEFVALLKKHGVPYDPEFVFG